MGRQAGDFLSLPGEEATMPPNVPIWGVWAVLSYKYLNVNMTATGVSSQLKPKVTKAELFN